MPKSHGHWFIISWSTVTNIGDKIISKIENIVQRIRENDHDVVGIKGQEQWTCYNNNCYYNIFLIIFKK